MRKFIAIPLLFVLSVIVVGAVGVAGCKQDEGERCQVADDCEDGFICNQATQTCAKTLGGGIDATVPDGPPVVVDGPPVVDAGLDATPDAP